jgi:hypothetical protein
MSRLGIVSCFVYSAMFAMACSDGNTQTSTSSSGASGGEGGAGGSAGAGGASSSNSSSSGTAGNGSGGGSSVCTPGEMVACYSGPFGTDGVGECKVGLKTCNAMGSDFGPCEGEVVPAMESCTTAGDEDCDGVSNEEGQDCVCVPGAFMLCYSGAPNSAGVGICKEGVLTCNPDGLGYGACMNEVVPGVEDCNTPEDEDCDGQTPLCPALWAHRYGSPAGDFVWSVGVDSAGNTIAVGDFDGTVDFGGGPLTSTGGFDPFIVKVDAMGNHVWSKSFGTAGLQSVQSVAITPTDEIVIAGYFQTSINFGGANLTTSGGSDMFVAKFDAAGTHLWSVRFGSGTDDQLALAVAVDAAGDVYFTGSFPGSIVMAGTTLASAGGADIIVAKLAGATGVATWAKKFGDTAIDQAGRAITVDAQGNVLVTGSFNGTANFGGNVLTSAGATDVFVAKFDPLGNHLYSAAFGDAGVQEGLGIAADAMGNYAVVGTSNGTLDLGGGPLPKVGNFDMFVGQFDSTGTHLKSSSFGSLNNDFATSVVWTGNEIAMTGYYDGKATFGNVTLQSAGGRDVFVAKLSAADLSVIGARSFGDSAFYQSGQSVKLDAMGNAIVGGYMQGTIDFGLGPLVSAGNGDAFLAKVPF